MLQQESEFRRLLKEMEGLTAPIIFHPGGWADSVPQEIRAQVPLERLALLLRGEWDRVTDAELVCYLFTYSLAEPITSDWTAIYAWLVGQWRPDLRGSIDIPEHLTDWQMEQLQDLGRKLRERQRRLKKGETMAEDLTIIVNLRSGGAMVAVGKEGCDPKTYLADPETEAPLAGLAEVAGALQHLVTDAEAQWEVSPRGPAYQRPAAAKPRAKTTAPAAPEASPEQEAPAAELPLLEEEQAPAEEAQAPAALGEVLATEEDTERWAPAEAQGAQPEVEGNLMRRREPEEVYQEYREWKGKEAPADLDVVAVAEAEPVEEAQAPVEDILPRAQVEEEPSLAYKAQAAEGPNHHEAAPVIEGEGAIIATPAEEAQAQPQAAVPQARTKGGKAFVVAGVRHPTVHAALLALGVPQQEIDAHKYWHRHDRLPKKHADAITVVDA